MVPNFSGWQPEIEFICNVPFFWPSKDFRQCVPSFHIFCLKSFFLSVGQFLIHKNRATLSHQKMGKGEFSCLVLFHFPIKKVYGVTHNATFVSSSYKTLLSCILPITQMMGIPWMALVSTDMLLHRYERVKKEGATCEVVKCWPQTAALAVTG